MQKEEILGFKKFFRLLSEIQLMPFMQNWERINTKLGLMIELYFGVIIWDGSCGR